MQVSGFADGAVGVTHAHELLELVKPTVQNKCGPLLPVAAVAGRDGACMSVQPPL